MHCRDFLGLLQRAIYYRDKIDLICQVADHLGVMVGDHPGAHQRKPELARADGIAHSWQSSTPLIRNWIRVTAVLCGQPSHPLVEGSRPSDSAAVWLG